MRGTMLSRILLQEEFDSAKATRFTDYPLSSKTQAGLIYGKFYEPSEIQAESIGLALRGIDILGAAKTGSGKTLAFLIPMLECLWRNRWSQLDGVGAIIISPTRELALQTYDVLKVIGCKHDFSVALTIGGSPWEFERDRISGTNIVICTPGRLLQHMDENPLWSADNLQMLVLDEADRILDLGFEQQLNALIENLPAQRQTLLFSATQTKSLKALARLSLKYPVFVSAHEHAAYSTPEQLNQNYVVCEEQDKPNLLWSFIKNHNRKKILVFFTSCKQVRFYYEAFRRLKVGMTIFGLYGTMNATRRLEVYDEFCRKQFGVLFATDIAARGLDFPSVDWVLQLDAPSDAEEYIHRCGRTARFNKEGESLLVLTASQETPMLGQLGLRKLPPIAKIHVNENKMNIVKKLEVLCTKDVNLKNFAQKCFLSYLRSVYLMKNKEVFNVSTIALEPFARSLGLAFAPRVRFLRRKGIHLLSGPIQVDSQFGEDRNMIVEEDTTCGMSDSEELFTVVQKKDYIFQTENNEKNDCFEKIELEDPRPERKSKRIVTREQLAKKMLKKKIKLNKKLVFGEHRETEQESGTESAVDDTSTRDKQVIADRTRLTACNGTVEPREGLNIQQAIKRMRQVDRQDRKTYRERLRKLKKERKLKKKTSEALRKNRQPPGGGVGVMLESRPEAEESGNSVSDNEAEEGNSKTVNPQTYNDANFVRTHKTAFSAEEELVLNLLES